MAPRISKSNKPLVLDDTVEIVTPTIDNAWEIAMLEEQIAIDTRAAEVAAKAVARAKLLASESADEKFTRIVHERQAELAQFRLSPLSLSILTRACDNVASNTGRGIEDPQQRSTVVERAALFAACGSEFVEVIETMAEALEPDDVPGIIYSTCFAVQKACNFAANIMYRKALDSANGEGTSAHDHRDLTDPPYGLGPDGEEPLEFDNTREHMDSTLPRHVEVLTAFEDLHLYLSIMPEAYGWQDEETMPYMFIANTNADGELTGNFHRVDSAEQALDIQEVRSAESRSRRATRQTAALSAVLAHRRKDMLRAAASRKPVGTAS